MSDSAPPYVILNSAENIRWVDRLWSGLALILGALGVGWLLFFRAVAGEWAVNAQYGYGYVVPFLAAILFWRRWTQRPLSRSSRLHAPATIAAGMLTLAVLPWMAALEANPEWRLLYWFGGIQMVALTLCFLYYLGGWSWFRWFALPLLFVLIAVPWPMELEQSIVQNLMRFVAGLTVNVSDLLGIPAVQHGNLIEVKAGIVGIDEACSGVRSLQSALMLSLFVGEMHLFSWRRRLGLLGASFLFVVFANVCRTSFLVWAAANRGLHQMEAWHDFAGQLVMWIVLPGLLAIGWIMKPRVKRTVAQTASAGPIALKIPRWIGLTALVWVAFCAIATELWYHAHERALFMNPRWTINWPGAEEQFQKSAVPELSLAILRCSNSEAGSWRDDAGNSWSAFILRWSPGKNSAQLAKGHRPDICFPAAGARLVEDFGRETIGANGIELSFRHQTFDTGGSIAHVFYCLWSDRRSKDQPGLNEDESRNSRLDAILAGERNLGQQVVEFVLRGPHSRDEATDLLRKELPKLVEVY